MMKTEFLKYRLFILFLLFLEISTYAQNPSWFYIRAKNETYAIPFENIEGTLHYKGTDTQLKKIFDNYTVYEFKKTFKKAKKENLKKTYFVVADKKTLMFELLKKASHVFEFGEQIQEKDKKIFEPNDYGLSSTLGENLGLQTDLSYLDFLEMPKAWYYTTGSKNTIIGISDAIVDTTDIDFKNKTKVFAKSTLSNGHGSSVASIAASQGDNAYGVPGVCYDCSIYATRYGKFQKLEQLMELSNLGVKVINCSWLNSHYYQTAQDVIDEMFENGTIIVAAAGNLNWKQTKDGSKLYYPASYNHVLSVSAGMYRNDQLKDNILKDKQGYPYAENIKGYVGRTIGFKNNNVNDTPYIYSVSVTTLNEGVDILAPSTGVFSFGKNIIDGSIAYDENEHTSNATPFVTGTIGLFFSLNPCLPVDEVESILKLTTLNIDGIKANKPYEGKYGAGLLNSGKAVTLVYNLYTESETAIIENQKFSRWDFKLTSFSEEVLIKNQEFKEASTFNLTAKNSIVIGKNTILRPNIDGHIVLKINPTLEKECELQLREGFPNNKYYLPTKNSFTN